MKVINPQAIGRYDAQNMLRIIANFPDQCRTALQICQSTIPDTFAQSFANITNIVVAGMGGSAIGGDVACSALRDHLRVPMLTNRSYTLPGFVDENTLFIAVSYSGNTEETLSCFDDAQRRGAQMVVISSGGTLGEKAVAANVPCLQIPPDQPPRTSLGYLCIPILSAISGLGLAPGFDLDAELEETIALLETMSGEYCPSAGDSLPMSLARKLHGALPVTYASHEMEAIAVRWRGQFCENSKTLAYSATFPEMNHNEIEGWETTTHITQQCYLIMLHDQQDHERVQARMEIAEQLIQCHARDVVHVHARGTGRLARIFSLIYIADWASFYLAILNEIDPTPVQQIDEFKARLSQVS